MNHFSYSVTITRRDGTTRVETGTFSHPNNAYPHSRVRVDVANSLAETLKPGETFDASAIEVRYAR